MSEEIGEACSPSALDAPVAVQAPSADPSLAGRTLAEWQAYAIDLHGKWRASEAALYEFRYPPCQALLRQIADEIDCGDRCENGGREWDTGAFVCSKAESADGCCFEKAASLRNFATALDTAALAKAAK